MIKNAVLHPIGEQPLVADLLVSPRPADISLLCTNLRTIDGKRPGGVDAPDALFILPLSTIRFVEVPASQTATLLAGLQAAPAAPTATIPGNGHASARGDGHDAAPRHARVAQQAALVPVPGSELYSVLRDPETPIALDASTQPAPDLEPDEDLLRRIRDI